MTRLHLLAGASALACFAGSAQAVEIDYWQYIYDTRVEAMDQLIAAFEEANPDITVNQVTFPYADYQTRIVAANMAGQGPDVMQLFYGWADKFIEGGLIQPLPEDVFPPEQIEEEFFPIVSAMSRDGQYYGLPTAVRSLALFWNKDLFAEAGIEGPPETLDELVEIGQQLTQTNDAGNFEVVGMTLDMAGQDHQWWREVLVRQMGGEPYSEDYSEVTYDDEAGTEALQFYTDLATVHGIGTPGFMDEGQAAFRAGRAAMTIDGTFRLGSFSSIEDFEWGVAELPANAEGVQSNYASYFANAIGSGAEGEEYDAAVKFLEYISSEEAMAVWLDVVGELPARRAAAMTDENMADPIYGPFLAALPYAHTTLFVDEAAQRQVAIDMTNRVLLEGQSPEDSIAEAAEEEQEIIDDARD
ncbi:extracellular solute-binding protein [Wenxinia saemankumensis]|uniref:Carbohydrate ABC transporter substrate-binding protein, CUT1 family n=1 Tax=Wenxinia saemankumensis TaxID=1447782 RepID=A0A1M6HT61_9RHOB|nr:extracellular solute-binding protein [Wenxinia saemankumensis]SHJ25334.1 carbohydrate ABC transporter substrate-binding protein, CUT1 family [Wenxinia saemankumensis]